MPRSRDDQDEDAALWAEMMEDVTPLPGRERPAGPPASSKKPLKAKASVRQPVPGSVQMAVKAGATIGSGIDTRNKNRLERGQMAIEATIDLHGHTATQAQQALTTFLLLAHHAGKRCVLVITGKGRLTKNDDKPWWDPKRGVLKAGFGDWVRQAPLDRIVLETAPARGKHGGGGAFYVLLRRDRDKTP